MFSTPELFQFMAREQEVKAANRENTVQEGRVYPWLKTHKKIDLGFGKENKDLITLCPLTE